MDGVCGGPGTALGRCLDLSANKTGRTPVHAVGQQGLGLASEENSQLFQELTDAMRAGLWGVLARETCGHLPLSSLSEEHTFCANLGVVRHSSSSEGLTRALGVSSEASLESNEVKLLLP